ncbi:uncharacterized protein GGS25DRAFT_524534 [Hypoxylon fragiforme]|uniref:uncharacterized protein n=1 Tax=Hypoxylon fragiforme TaxID=63214 RepID=UPI0020C7014E|nr:uncharacterized protein GGS25DRAFT_524534 [Hypoxylon fragiforme]KAI2605032.1 hypothetical protein GGS25DRAFT_524534 [Hypoxylon fragiforme]
MDSSRSYDYTSSLKPNQDMPSPDSQYDSMNRRLSGSRSLTSTTGVSGSDNISPLSSGLDSNSSQTSQAGLHLYHPQTSWSLPGNSTYTHSPMNHGAQAGLMQPNYNRSIYTPTGPPAYNRNSQSPATADGLATPAYESASSPFPQSIQGGGANQSTLLSQSSSQQSLQSTIMNSHTPGSQPPTPSTTSSQDGYSRAQSGPNYYTTQSSSTHQSSYPAYPPMHHSPPQTSPVTTGSYSRGITTLSPHQHNSPMQAPHYQSRPYPSYNQMSLGPGAVLSNMSNPGGQMTIVGGMNPIQQGYPSPHLVSPQTMYSHGQQNSLPDRPFRCDLCPTSFNRNHDLKRHKRIHLAIKPFPCKFCDKSFSRKDALKRHRLVKGCGNGKDSPSDHNSRSPRDDSIRDMDGPSGSSREIKQEP